MLPLDNFSGHPEDAYFADGMTEALIADLAQIKGLRVISRTSTQQYKGNKKPLPVVAQELNADLIVEGAVTKIGDRVRITFGRVVLVKAQIMSNDATGAIRTCEQLNAAAADSADLLVSCAIAYSRAGDEAHAKAIVAQLSAARPPAWPSIAQWYAATGDTARAFSLFEQLRKDGNLPPNLAFDPLFEPLRGDPRFGEYSSPAGR